MPEIRLPHINKVLLTGYLTRDPELRYTKNDIPVCNFRLAISRKYKISNNEWKENVCYVNIVAWKRLAELSVQHLRKSSAVFIEGELQNYVIELDHKTLVEIRAFRIQFLDKNRHYPIELVDSDIGYQEHYENIHLKDNEESSEESHD